MLAIMKHIVEKVRFATGTRFFQRIYHYTHRIPIRLEKLEKVKALVFAPHPDDESIGAGGTLIQLSELGSDIKIVWISTNKKDDTIAAERKEEARKVTEVLGATYEFWDFPDGDLSRYENQIRKLVSRIVSEKNPDVIFVPHPAEQHRDHQATAAAVAFGINDTKFDKEIWAYEVWAPMWPNVAVGLEETLEKKRNLISIYESQIKNVNYIEAILGLNSYRGLQCFIPAAEAFYVTSKSDFYKLCLNLFRL